MLSFATNETHVSVSGPATFHIKEVLKNFSGRWSPESRSWAVPIKHDNDTFRANLLETAKEAKRLEREEKKALREKEAEAENERRIYLATPEGKEAARQERIALNKARQEDDEQRMARGELPVYGWIYCLECEVINWKTKMTSCDACADDYGLFKNTIRIRGGRYTGD
jgi:hypothetical protein